jgi:uncharacterized protein (DUF1015 family)
MRMASIHPFRALRPAPARAAAVSSVPYDVVSTEEARELAEGNPLSFLHVTRAEIDLPADTDPHSPRVYEKARENFASLRERAPLVLDDIPSLYFYRLRMGAHEQTGIAGCFSLDEYDADVIKKGVRDGSGLVHRGRSPSGGQCGACTNGLERPAGSQRRWGRREHVHRRGVPR